MLLFDIAKKLKDDYNYDGVNVQDLIEVLRDGFEIIRKTAIEEGDGFICQLPRFGSFRVVKRKARIGFNPKTKEKINIPEKLKFTLRTSGKFRLELAESTSMKRVGGAKAKTKAKPKAKAKSKAKAKKK